MAVSDEFLDYIIDQLAAWGEITSRRMFGGAGLFRDGKMFGLVSDDVVYFKVDEINKEKFIAAGSEPFKPFPNRPTLTSYFELPPDILEDSDELIEWADESLSVQKK